MAIPEQDDLKGLYQTSFRRALYLLGTPSAAEDAAQEAFYRYLSSGRRASRTRRVG